ncbi:hypothetical protein [Streptomyces sp. NPDC057426]|uniref:hypothetical protein n=1 Tax=Streptomyces sp. NPDC057426 TaxID=3346128 RepID=UPI0036779EC9
MRDWMVMVPSRGESASAMTKPGWFEDRRGDGLGEHRLGQQVVVGGLRLLERQRVVNAGLGGEPHRVAAGVGVRGREVRAAAQRVGDADRVVVGVEQRALVAVDGLSRSSGVVTSMSG